MRLKLIAIFLALTAGLILVPKTSLAEGLFLDTDTKASQYEQETAFEGASGLNFDLKPGQIVSTIIKTVLSLLGIIFVVLIIYSGFQWMTAQGNEEKVTKAKETIGRAVIGLLIVVAAWSITYFVFAALNNTVGGGAAPG
jgi:amino acid transporter